MEISYVIFVSIFLIMPSTVQGLVCPAATKVVYTCKPSSQQGPSIYLDTSDSFMFNGSCTCRLQAVGGPVTVRLTAVSVPSGCVALLDFSVLQFLVFCNGVQPEPSTGTIEPGADVYVSLVKKHSNDAADFCIHIEQTNFGDGGVLNVSCVKRTINDIIDKEAAKTTILVANTTSSTSATTASTSNTSPTKTTSSQSTSSIKPSTDSSAMSSTLSTTVETTVTVTSTKKSTPRSTSDNVTNSTTVQTSTQTTLSTTESSTPVSPDANTTVTTSVVNNTTSTPSTTADMNTTISTSVISNTTTSGSNTTVAMNSTTVDLNVTTLTGSETTPRSLPSTQSETTNSFTSTEVTNSTVVTVVQGVGATPPSATKIADWVMDVFIYGTIGFLFLFGAFVHYRYRNRNRHLDDTTNLEGIWA